MYRYGIGPRSPHPKYRTIEAASRDLDQHRLSDAVPMFVDPLNCDLKLQLVTLMQCLGSDYSKCCVADLDHDGQVGMSDVMLLIHMLVHSVPFES